jgi:hypothetical protein
MTRLPYAVLFALCLASPAHAGNGDHYEFPNDLSDFHSSCKRFGANESAEVAKMSINWCIQLETEARDSARYFWADLPLSAEFFCAAEAKINANNLVKYQTLNACVQELAVEQHAIGGELPLSYQNSLIARATQALKVGHF